jgi:LmbE family N-acetylglucosaminyl deacetylase
MRPPDESSGVERHLDEDRRTVTDLLAPLLPAHALHGPFLFVAARPDDEVLGASWLLRRSPGCHVIHVTDGAPRDISLRPLHAPPTREDWARIREEESFAALALAGVNRDHLLSLSAVDQEASLELATLTHCLVALMKALRPTLLVVPPYEGGHPDSDAAAFISHAAVALVARTGRTPPVLLEMDSDHRGFPPAPEAQRVATVALTGAERAAKQRMLACYASRAQQLESFPLAREHYRAAPRYDFTRTPRPEGAPWRALARGALEELKLPEAPWH